MLEGDITQVSACRQGVRPRRGHRDRGGSHLHMAGVPPLPTPPLLGGVLPAPGKSKLREGEPQGGRALLVLSAVRET